MCHLALRLALIVVLVLPGSAGVDEASRPSSKISLVLPPGVASETIQITYFMVGPFGGYRGFVTAEKNRRTYDIDASVDGHAATGIKVIAYLPGCEIATLAIPVQGTALERQLPCKPLGSISLHGQILPVSITQEQPTEVEVVYLATWSQRFFGFSDGMVTTVHLATVVPDENGQFQVKLPDLYKQTRLGDGVYEFFLRDPTSGNIIASLEPTELGTNSYGLKLRSSYAPVVQFMAKRQ